MFKLIDDLSQSLFSRHWGWQAQYQGEKSSDGFGVRFQIGACFAQSYEDFKWFLGISIGVVDGDEGGAERCSFPGGDSVQSCGSRCDFGGDYSYRLSFCLFLGQKDSFSRTFPVDRDAL